jgi:nucleoside-diphosphate-sugar epimerase
MRICITGCLGFVARAFVRRLREDGHEIFGCDNLSAGKPPVEWLEQSQGIHVFYTDLRNYVLVQDVDAFDLIIHCAAVVGGRMKIDGDPLAVATDLAIDADFFNWVARGRRKKKIIYFSSSAAYPKELQTRKHHVALAEGMLDMSDPALTRLSMPDQTYGWSKLSGEYLAHYAVSKYGADVVIYRPFGGYGPDQDFTYPFPSIVKRVLDKESPVTVWGSGEQKRDFIHIDDVVDAVLTTKDKLGPGQVLNLGTGIGVSFKELASLACNILGHKAEVVADTERPEGVFHRVADTYKLDQFFQPRISLEVGIKRVAQFLQGGKL